MPPNPPPKKKKTLTTTKNPDGSQQYLKGDTQAARAMTAWNTRDLLIGSKVNYDNRAELSRMNKATKSMKELAISETRKVKLKKKY